MHTYYVTLRTSTHWGALYVEAESPSAACTKARNTDYEDIPFQPYQEVGEIEEIEVFDDDSEGTLLHTWHAEPYPEFPAMAEVYWLLVSFWEHMKRWQILSAAKCAHAALRIAS